MKLRVVPFVIILLITTLVAVTGSLFTTTGLIGWYPTLNLPAWTPDGGFIGIMWTLIYVLTATSAILAWHAMRHSHKLRFLVWLFLANAILNVLWSFIFFEKQAIAASIVDMLILNITTIALVLLIWPFQRLAAILLFPYIGWVSFATYLAYSVWVLNS